MDRTTPAPVSIEAMFASLTFLADRSPETEDERYFATLSSYRDGAMFVAHCAGRSDRECHPVGDEIVLVIEGRRR